MHFIKFKLINMGKNKKYIKLILVLISLFIPVVIFAYRPGPSEACKKAQYFLLNTIIDCSELEEIKLTDFLPGSECDKICNDIKFTFDQKRMSEKCTYGLTLVKGEPKLYCSYHGNTENIKNFIELNFNRIRPSKVPNGFIILFVCILGLIVISSIKSIIKKYFK